MEALLFEAAGRSCAAPLDDLNEVMMMVALHPLATPGMAGAMVLRGALLPVVALRDRLLALGLGQSDRVQGWPHSARILRCTTATGQSLGIAVDRVVGIVELEEANRRPTPERTVPFLGDLWLQDGVLVQELRLAVLSPEGTL